MNVAVVGSRDWPDERAMYREVARVLNELEEHIIEHIWPCPEYPSGREGLDYLTIVSGGARGVDSAAADWVIGCAGMSGLIEHLPDWRKHGRAAGFVRNRRIVEDADLVLAFQRGGSRGTQSTINIARNLGVPVIVWES